MKNLHTFHKIICLAIILVMCFSFIGAADETGITLSYFYDPAEDAVVINGCLPTGPEHIVNIIFGDINNKCFIDETKTIKSGKFIFKIPCGDFTDGVYGTTIKSDDGYNYNIDINLKKDISPILINASLINGYAVMLDENRIDSNQNKFTVVLNNCKTSVGKKTQTDFKVQGLPDGMYLDAVSQIEDTIEFSIGGKADISIEADFEFYITLNSSVISSGLANTAGVISSPCKVYSEKNGNTVSFEEFNHDLQMKNGFQLVNDELTLKLQKGEFISSRKLIDGVDYECTIPSELKGFTLSLTSDKDNGTLLIAISGTPILAIQKNQTITGIVIKSKVIKNAKYDSTPFNINIIGQTTLIPTVGGGSSGGGGGGGSSLPPVTSSQNTIEPDIPIITRTFDDIKDHWAKQYIEKLATEGIVNGISRTEFAPERNVTRAEFVSMIIRKLGLKLEDYTEQFNDVKEDSWYAKYVITAVDNKIISEDVLFRPNDNITRAEMAKMIANIYLIKNQKPQWLAEMTSLADYGIIPSWAKESVDLCMTLGVFKGDDKNMFLPLSNAKRAESAAVICRMADAFDF